MNIIFGNTLESLPSNYITLELDTIKMAQSDQNIIAYCLVEDIPLAEFSKLDTNRTNHKSLIEQYKKQNWQFCLDMIEQLIGAWAGQVDSFYNDLKIRIETLQKHPPGPDWDGTIVK